MVMKVVLSLLFIALVMFLLAFYWFFPFGEIELRQREPVDYNFSISYVGELANPKAQFYPNMRFPAKRISYKISGCILQKKNDMENAFRVIESETILYFYPVQINEQITVTCDAQQKFEEGLFIAGEGGPTNITQTSNFNIVTHGKVLLLRQTNCPKPNVGIHELLHVLGFDHSTNENNIMYPVSKCNQEIGQDSIDLINSLYSIEELPDLAFEDIFIETHSRYIDAEISIRNQGLKNAEEADLLIYANDKVIKKVDIDSLDFGYGIKISLENILITKINLDEIKFIIETDFEELSKENNERTFLADK